MANIEFKQNFKDFIKVYQSASSWRSEKSPVYSRVWDPEYATEKTYLEEFLQSNAWVLYLDESPVAGAVLTDPKEVSFALWSTKFEDFNELGALYLDDTCVIANKIGKGIFKLLLEKIEGHAKTNGYSNLRLDTDSRLSKVVDCYVRNGFEVIKQEQDDHMERVSVYLVKNI